MSFSRFIFLATFSLIFISLSAQIPKTGQVMWLQSDKGVITDSKGYVKSWADQSGNSVNASQTAASAKPLLVNNSLNSHPVLRFNGTSNYLNCPSKFPTNSDFTVIALVRINNYSNTNTILGGNTSTAFWMLGNNKPSLWNNGVSEVASTIPVSADFTSITATINYKTKNTAIYINDSLAGTGIDSVKNTDAGISIGDFAGNYFLDGDIAEIIIYKRVLTNSEIDSVNQYFNDKYLLKGTNGNVIMKNFPNYYQFYPRKLNDSALVPIGGNVISSGYDTVILDVLKNDTLWKSFKSSLIYSSGGAGFSFSPKIKAGLYEYSFILHLKNNTLDTLVGYRKDIVCGDMYMVDGQSNTVYAWPTSKYTNEYVRTFGSNTGGGVGIPSDTFWNRANGSSFLYYTICSWGIKMAQMLKEKENMPICIINGGVGGTTVGYHLEDTTNPTNLYYNYGRLLYRIQKAGMVNSIKAIFWYQGESNSIYDYSNQFHQLYKEWKKTYPGFKHFYMVQVHTGCNSGNAAEVRNLLRTLPDTLGNASPVATANLPGHDLDHCHYYEKGYDSLGLHLFRMVDRDFYNSSDTLNISPPDVKKVFYTDSTYQEIGILFRENNAGLKWTSDITQTLNSGKSFIFNIKHAFYLNDSFDKLSSVSISGDTLKLKLKSSSCRYTNITYIPDNYYENTYNTYEGPWLINRRNIGALTFYHFPIDTFVPKVHTKLAFIADSICIGQTCLFIDNSTLKSGIITTWEWKFGDSSGASTKNSAHRYKRSGNYNVQLKTTNSTGSTDSMTNIIKISPLPNASYKITTISGRTFQFSPIDSSLKHYSWDFGDGSYSFTKNKKFTYSNDGVFLSTLKVTDSAGCTNSFSDTLHVTLTGIENAITLNNESLSISPNPFTHSAIIKYSISNDAIVRLYCIDNTGKIIRILVSSSQDRGEHIVELNAEKDALKSGIFQLVLEVNNQRLTKTFIRL